MSVVEAPVCGAFYSGPSTLTQVVTPFFWMLKSKTIVTLDPPLTYIQHLSKMSSLLTAPTLDHDTVHLLETGNGLLPSLTTPLVYSSHSPKRPFCNLSDHLTVALKTLVTSLAFRVNAKISTVAAMGPVSAHLSALSLVVLS